MRISYRNIQLGCAAFIVLWLNSSLMALYGASIPSALKFGIVLLWFVLAIRCEHKFLKSYTSSTASLFVMLIIMVISQIMGISQYYSSYFMSYMYITIIAGMSHYYYKYGNQKEIKFLLFVFLADFLIKTIRTYQVLLTNPIVVRALSTTTEYQSILLEGKKYQGIGNYDWCYQLAFFVIVLLYYNKKNKKLSGKIVSYGLIASSIFILFTAQITTAFIMSVAFVFAIIALEEKKSRFASVTKMLYVIGALVILLNVKNIILFIADLADEHMAERLLNLVYTFNSKDASSGDIGSRMNLYKLSLDAFFESPLWGSFGDRTFGFHSTFLDLLGAYGLLGLFGIVGILSPLLNTLSQTTNQERTIMRIVVITYILFSTVNVSTWWGSYMVACFIIPMCMKLKSKTELLEN